jgi:hypothetical protein
MNATSKLTYCFYFIIFESASDPPKTPLSFGGGIGMTTLPVLSFDSAAARLRSRAPSTPHRSSSSSSFSRPSAERCAAARSGRESLTRGGAEISGFGRAQAASNANGNTNHTRELTTRI